MCETMFIKLAFDLFIIAVFLLASYLFLNAICGRDDLYYEQKRIIKLAKRFSWKAKSTWQ